MSDHSANPVGEQEEVLHGATWAVRYALVALSGDVPVRGVRRFNACWNTFRTPRPLGTDEHRRDSVSYLPGIVPQYPLPDWTRSQEVLTDAGRYLAELHQASAGFDTADAVWQSPVRQPAEVICHNDFAPYNLVFTDRWLTGVIDWDTASPGPRSWDLAYLAYRLVPLADPDNFAVTSRSTSATRCGSPRTPVN